jgi:hypothetical protein
MGKRNLYIPGSKKPIGKYVKTPPFYNSTPWEIARQRIIEGDVKPSRSVKSAVGAMEKAFDEMGNIEGGFGKEHAKTKAAFARSRSNLRNVGGLSYDEINRLFSTTGKPAAMLPKEKALKDIVNSMGRFSAKYIVPVSSIAAFLGALDQGAEGPSQEDETKQLNTYKNLIDMGLSPNDIFAVATGGEYGTPGGQEEVVQPKSKPLTLQELLLMNKMDLQR